MRAFPPRPGCASGPPSSWPGRSFPPFQVVGLATTSGGNPADNWTVFLSNPEAASLYGHPGQADLIGIVARPGVSATALAGRVRTALEGSDLTVLSGRKIGQAENLTVGLDKMGLSQLATTGGIYIIAIASSSWPEPWPFLSPCAGETSPSCERSARRRVRCAA